MEENKRADLEEYMQQLISENNLFEKISEVISKKNLKIEELDERTLMQIL